jgi:hypothetical protein
VAVLTVLVLLCSYSMQAKYGVQAAKLLRVIHGPFLEQTRRALQGNRAATPVGVQVEPTPQFCIALSRFLSAAATSGYVVEQPNGFELKDHATDTYVPLERAS